MPVRQSSIGCFFRQEMGLSHDHSFPMLHLFYQSDIYNTFYDRSDVNGFGNNNRSISELYFGPP
jgi:hypothetical protein